MATIKDPLKQLLEIRTHFGPAALKQKMQLLKHLAAEPPHNKNAAKEYYHLLLFMCAYPDSTDLRKMALKNLHQLVGYINAHAGFQYSLFNTGISGTHLCASFSYDVVKWLRDKFGKEVTLDSFEAEDGQISSIVSAVMPKVESEIFQDENAHWREWLHHYAQSGDDLLDSLLRIFAYSDLRPEVKDELWGALGLNITVHLKTPDCLPKELVFPYYHNALIKTKKVERRPQKIKLTNEQAEAVIEAARIVLIKNFREIDPISFSSPELVTYYRLDRGITVALFGMVHAMRHPIDSYMGYVAFKNGMPVAYAGSWVLFDSARIGLNVFPSYRGGESRYAFEEVMNLHKVVYHLKRFTVDPYQIGKHNKDGIHSGAFWLYHHLRFRPIKPQQRQLAEAEALKIAAQKGYRTPESTLKKLADSRMELPLKGNSVGFDAVDISIAYANYLNTRFKGRRDIAEAQSMRALLKFIGFKNTPTGNLLYAVRNWAPVLMHDPKLLKGGLRNDVKRMFELKTKGAEEDYMALLRNSKGIRLIAEQFVSHYA